VFNFKIKCGNQGIWLMEDMITGRLIKSLIHCTLLNGLLNMESEIYCLNIIAPCWSPTNPRLKVCWWKQNIFQDLREKTQQQIIS